MQPASESYYTPIKALNQFNNDWCIKARITKKPDMRTWKNARGEGTLLNIDLIDKDSTRIQATFFNDMARKFNDELTEDAVYTFSGGQVKLANKKFTSIANDYCITFDKDTIIKKCEEDKAITGGAFSFSNLEKIEAMV
jgi:replication factor A1